MENQEKKLALRARDPHYLNKQQYRYFGAWYLVVRYDKDHLVYNIKNSSGEIEDLVETHLCKLCVILRSRELRVLYCLMQEIQSVYEEGTTKE